MRSDLYALSRENKHDPWLVKDLVMGANMRIGETLCLMPINPTERELNYGRFTFFERVPQQWTATIRRTRERMRGDPGIESMIEWIAENADSPWSFDIDQQSSEDDDETRDLFFLRFSFIDSTVGVMFKMLFA